MKHILCHCSTDFTKVSYDMKVRKLDGVFRLMISAQGISSHKKISTISNKLRHQWFKLDLDPSQSRGVSELSRQFPDQHALPPSYSTSAEKLCTDYLTALRIHTEQVLKHKLPQSVLRSTPIEYIITVPAVWSDLAQAKTRSCASSAGMGKGLQIISEPEAAAIYALHAMDPHSIRVGDTFVLCDAGGGTVDLISYTVSGLKPILQVEEAAMGTGRICGSTFLNRIFQKFLEEKLGLNEEWDDEVVEDAMKRFELVTKKVFRGDLHEEYLIPGKKPVFTLMGRD